MRVQADKAETEFFNLESTSAGVEVKPKEPVKTLGPPQIKPFCWER